MAIAAAAAAAAGFIDVMSAILLTLFINPHPSDQPSDHHIHSNTVHFLSEARGGGGSQVSGRLSSIAAPA